MFLKIHLKKRTSTYDSKSNQLLEFLKENIEKNGFKLIKKHDYRAKSIFNYGLGKFYSRN